MSGRDGRRVRRRSRRREHNGGQPKRRQVPQSVTSIIVCEHRWSWPVVYAARANVYLTPMAVRARRGWVPQPVTSVGLSQTSM